MKEKNKNQNLYSLRKLSVADSLNELNDLLLFNERKIRKKPTKILTNELKIKISELIRKHDNNEDIAGALESIGKISKEYALEIITEYEDILIEKILTGKETGDIGDILLVVSDLSKEKSIELLETITSEKIFKRMFEKDFHIHIRGVGWLLQVINEISPRFAIELLDKIGIELIIDLIETHRSNTHAVTSFINYIENISEDYSKLIKDKFDMK